jgi:hypothetical protein
MYRWQGGRWLRHQHRRLWRAVKPSDRTQDFAAITGDSGLAGKARHVRVRPALCRAKDNAEIFQISIGQVPHDGEIEPVHRRAAPGSRSGFWTSRTGNFSDNIAPRETDPNGPPQG